MCPDPYQEFNGATQKLKLSNMTKIIMIRETNLLSCQ